MEEYNKDLNDCQNEIDSAYEMGYDDGFIDGLTAYAYWADGEQFVGTSGKTLKEAIEKVKETWNYKI